MQKITTSSLPAPDPAALMHSQHLQALIAQEIITTGPISFARFMELALYAPGLGYYTAGSRKLGKDGDFVTAPEISALFSRALSRQCGQILAATSGDILEFGAGSGQMAVTLLTELERCGNLPQHYYIVEVSADLKERQQGLLSSELPHLINKVVWLDTLPTSPIKGVFLANEVLDAFPVHLFTQKNNILQECQLNYEGKQFIWQFKPAPPSLKSYLEDLAIPFEEGYTSECNLLLPGWLNSIGQVLAQGAVILIDYGFPRSEYYHPDRHQGTLMCHYRHHAHTDPLQFIGLQDITTHVDFTAVVEAGFQAGLTLGGYTNQAHFLLACGIVDYLKQTAIDEKYYQLANEVKVLTSPTEMGELFKVMALTKNLSIPLIGFSLRDYSERL